MMAPEDEGPRSAEKQLTLEDRLWRLEARVAIQELVAHYCYTLDLRDTDALMACFTEDAELRRSDGTFASGRDELRAYYLDNLRLMGPTMHLTLGNLVLDTLDRTSASGRHYGLAEHAVDDELVVAAMTYNHEYRLVDGRWLISRRVVEFWYFCRAADLFAHYGTRGQHWWRGVAPPQLPESSPTWAAFARDHLGAGPQPGP